MIIKNNHEYRKISIIKYNNKSFQLFLDDYNKLAILEIDKNNTLIYPNIKDVLSISKMLTNIPRDLCSLSDSKKKIKKYRFIPKVVVNGSVILLTTAILSACASPEENEVITLNLDTGSSYTTEESSSSEQLYVKPTVELEEYDEEIYKSLTDDYIQFLSPADDEYDYNWKYDYNKEPSKLFVSDSKVYEEIFGFSKPTKDELLEELNNNNNLDAEYKEILTEYINNWLTLWPDSDLSALKNNLSTLQINKITSDQMVIEGGSDSVNACYNVDRNTIYINENSNYQNKNSVDYLILIHEIIHASRNSYFYKDDQRIEVSFTPDPNLSLFTDEALVNNFAYQLTNVPYDSYSLQTNYYKMIIDAIGYDGNDYMNHSYNYLFDKMDNYMGDDEYAYHISSLIGFQGMIHYNQSRAITSYDNFIEIYDYMVKLYCKKNLQDDLSYYEALEKFDDFWSQISYNLKSWAPYKDVNEDYIYTVYEQYVSEHYDKGLSK